MPEFHIGDRAMANLVDQVREFHEATDTPCLERPTIPGSRRKDLRIRLIQEEVTETIDALEADDLVEIADGLADIIYVCIGAALEYGIPLDKVWFQVQQSNMAKVDPLTGKANKRDDGKIIKPEGWQPPNIASVLDLE